MLNTSISHQVDLFQKKCQYSQVLQMKSRPDWVQLEHHLPKDDV
jgi:hypothetical protein